MQLVWGKHAKKGVWGLKSARSWRKVKRALAECGGNTHMSRVFGVCVDKGSELPKGSPGRKFKGRFVFQGDKVRDVSNEAVVFHIKPCVDGSLEVHTPILHVSR